MFFQDKFQSCLSNNFNTCIFEKKDHLTCAFKLPFYLIHLAVELQTKSVDTSAQLVRMYADIKDVEKELHCTSVKKLHYNKQYNKSWY